MQLGNNEYIPLDKIEERESALPKIKDNHGNAKRGKKSSTH